MVDSHRYRDKATLRKLYHNDGLTLREIADKFGTSISTIHRWMDKHDIDRRYSGTLKERFEQYHEKDANESGCWLWQNKPDEWGYGTIWDADKPGHRKAHRVAFDLFCDEELPAFSPDSQVNHTCHNPSCVNPEHLYLGTQQENVNDAVEAEAWGENRKRGSGIGNSKLTEEAVAEIKQRCLNGESQKALSEDFGVAHSTVNKIMVGQQWLHVGPDVTEERRGESERYGEMHPNSKLTEDDVRTIRELREGGATVADIAERMPVGTTSVRNILKGRTWQHVE